MKKTKFVLSIVSLLLLGACSSSGTSDSPSDGSTTKATLSSWNISNNAWSVRLDAGGANLSGSTFTFIGKFADNSEIDCANSTMVGTDASGTWTTASCTDDGNSAHSAYGQEAIFFTNGAGTYTNDGTTLQLCRHSGTCLSYH